MVGRKNKQTKTNIDICKQQPDPSKQEVSREAYDNKGELGILEFLAMQWLSS